MIFPQSEGLASLNYVQFNHLSLKKQNPFLKTSKEVNTTTSHSSKSIGQ